MRTPLLLAASLLFAAATHAADPLPPRLFPHSERIRYDAHCLTIDGKDTLIYSGAFHYFRCPKELWPARFQKIKDAGFNAVESYVAWNWHERQMPASLEDFSKVDLRDLDDWLTMAESFGLNVIIRPGPYICAEWNAGGFPQWLLTKKPAESARSPWLRSDDPVFLAWAKHWFDAVCPVIAKHQITRQAPGKPGVILFQLENEYDFARKPAEEMNNQVRVLAQAAAAQGIDVPMFTCWTRSVRGTSDPVLRQVFDTCNFYPRWGVDGIRGDIERTRREQPDAPLMTTELQGGWFSKVGGKLSEQQEGLTPAQIQNLTLYAIQNGDTITNYYMLFGGTNLDDDAARDITATYDYAAPLREDGTTGARYARVAALGHMLREHGGRLARSEAVECEATAPDKDVEIAVRRSADGGRYVFVRTSQHEKARKGVAHVKEKREKGDPGPEYDLPYDLEPFGAMVLYMASNVSEPAKGEWLLDPKFSRPERTNHQPIAAEIIKKDARGDDSAAEKWLPLRPGQHLEDVGIYDSHFVSYRVPAKAGQKLKVDLRQGDAVVASANGVRLPKADEITVPDGTKEIVLLYENAGHPNGGAGMEERCGIRAVRVVDANAAADNAAVNGWSWTARSGSLDDIAKYVFAVKTVNPMTAVDLSKSRADQLKPDEGAVFQAIFDLPAEALQSGRTWLTFEHIDDDGRIFVNGQALGETFDWSRTYSFNAAKLLRAGSNEIQVAVKNGDGPGGLGPVRLSKLPDPGLALEVASSEREQGLAWSQPDFDSSGWQSPDVSKTPLLWQRMEFTLPTAKDKDGAAAPWKLQLEAHGNGFIYLNGHCVGRYWEAGPQHDFYLPECWLNVGAGKKNAVLVSLRPLETGAQVNVMQVSNAPLFKD